MRVLDVLLRKLHREKRRVLLFSTMTRVLDLLQDYLEYRHYAYQRLDGSVRAEERTLAVNAFQHDEDVFCFLLSTRAGGQGLNLTSADTVIFMDSDFNPQCDKQAEARAHRIGQTKPVTIVRLVTKRTVEEIFFRRSRSKLFLSQAVVEQGRGAAADDGDGADDGMAMGAMSNAQMLEVVRFGVASLEDTRELAPIAEDDLESMIRDAWSKSQQQQQQKPVAVSAAPEPALKRGKTIVPLAAGDGIDESANDNMYDWQEDERDNAADAVALQQLLERADEQLPVQRTAGARASLGERRATKVRRSDTGANKLARLQKLWDSNGYRSLKVAAADGDAADADSGAGDNNDDARDLQYVNGDAAAAPFGVADRPKIVLLVANQSGEWPGRGMFASVRHHHGAAVQDAYESAKRNRDLHLGDCHLVASERAGHYVALAVAMAGNGTDVRPPAFRAALEALAGAAAGLAASVHVARLAPGSGLDWYSAERRLRRAFSRVDCFVYYFARAATATVPLARSLVAAMPNHFAGHVFSFAVELDAALRQRLFRLAIAYGGVVSNDGAQPVGNSKDYHTVVHVGPVADKGKDEANGMIVWSVDEFEKRAARQ